MFEFFFKDFMIGKRIYICMIFLIFNFIFLVILFCLRCADYSTFNK